MLMRGREMRVRPAALLLSSILLEFTSKCAYDVLPFMWCVFNSRSKGVILNISSASGMLPVPLLTVYSATKVTSTAVNYVNIRRRGDFQSGHLTL